MDAYFELQLPGGHVALVSECDRELVSGVRWVVHIRKGYVYGNCPVRGKHRNTDSMHRLIMNFPDCQVDHINGNRLDNRRENLRLCNNTQNQGNRRKTSRPTTCKYKGVNKRPHGKYRAQIKNSGKYIHLGTFATEHAAARAYDRAALEYFGEFANPNFPREQYELAK